MLLPNRHGSSDKYRYGFQGEEKDDEIKGEGNSYTTHFRKYDPRIGRWFSVDPKFKLQPYESPYSYANNMPIIGNDPDGDVCVPCVVIIAGLLLTPEVAMAPTGNSSDMQAYMRAKDLQANWIKNVVLLSGLSGSGALAGQLRKELIKQAGYQIGINSSIEVFKNIKDGDFNDFDASGVILTSFNSLDLADAAIGKLNLNKMQTIIASSLIDITPEQISLLGNTIEQNKLKETANGYQITADILFNALAEFSDNKIAKANMKSALKKLVSKADDVIEENVRKALKDQLGEAGFIELMNEINEIHSEKNKSEVRVDKTSVRRNKINEKLKGSKPKFKASKPKVKKKKQAMISQG